MYTFMCVTKKTVFFYFGHIVSYVVIYSVYGDWASVYPFKHRITIEIPHNTLSFCKHLFLFSTFFFLKLVYVKSHTVKPIEQQKKKQKTTTTLLPMVLVVYDYIYI